MMLGTFTAVTCNDVTHFSGGTPCIYGAQWLIQEPKLGE